MGNKFRVYSIKSVILPLIQKSIFEDNTLKIRYSNFKMGFIYLIKICSLKDAYLNRVFSFRNMYNNKILESIEIDSNKNMCGIVKDDICIYKFGKTKKLDRRFVEHCKSYNCINIKIVHYKIVDDNQLSIEENKVKNFFLDRNVFFVEKSYNNFRQYKELVLIRDEDLKSYIDLCFASS
jgi:hypothetical protein